MAAEIKLQTSPAITGTVKAVIRNNAGQVWQITTSTFVSFVDSNINDYGVALTEQGTSSGFYVGDFPTGITSAGTYDVVVYSQAGGSLVVGDTIIGDGEIIWDGSAEVPAASTSDDLISLDYAKELLAITSSTYDSFVTNRISAASKAIASYCRRNLVPKDYTSYIDGNDDWQILLPQYPVTALTSVTLDAWGSSPTTISGDQYIVNYNTGEIRLKPTSTANAFFRGGFQNIKVIFSAGYDPIPADLQQACGMVVKLLFIQRGDEQLVTMEKLGDYQASYAKAQGFIDGDLGIRAILDHYKNWA